VHLFGMNVTAKTTVVPRLDGNVLKATITSMEVALSVIDSSVGPVSTTLLGMVFDVLKKMFIIPKLNEAGEKGFPLPAIKHIQFTNTVLQLDKECILVSTNVKYSPTK